MASNRAKLVFKRYDSNQDGWWSENDFRNFLKAIGKGNIGDTRIRSCFRYLDTAKRGAISFEMLQRGIDFLFQCDFSLGVSKKQRPDSLQTLGPLALKPNHFEVQPEGSDPLAIYTLEDCVGSGSFGNIFKAIHKTTGEIIALKVIEIEKTTEDLDDILAEVDFQAKCFSPHLVRYIGSWLWDNKLFIAMEYLGGGTLEELIKHSILNEEQCAYVLREVLKGIEYLHESSKIHRDIKPANILFDSQGNIKLGDFGVAAELTHDKMKRVSFVGTPLFLAPEIVLNNPYDSMVDIWSLGVMAILLATGQAPHAEKNPNDVLYSVLASSAPRLEGNWSRNFKDFVAKCCEKDPSKRSTASELLKHPFVVIERSPSVIKQTLESYKKRRPPNVVDDKQPPKLHDWWSQYVGALERDDREKMEENAARERRKVARLTLIRSSFTPSQKPPNSAVSTSDWSSRIEEFINNSTASTKEVVSPQSDSLISGSTGAESLSSSNLTFSPRQSSGPLDGFGSAQKFASRLPEEAPRLALELPPIDSDIGLGFNLDSMFVDKQEPKNVTSRVTSTCLTDIDLDSSNRKMNKSGGVENVTSPRKRVSGAASEQHIPRKASSSFGDIVTSRKPSSLELDSIQMASISEKWTSPTSNAPSIRSISVNSDHKTSGRGSATATLEFAEETLSWTSTTKGDFNTEDDSGTMTTDRSSVHTITQELTDILSVGRINSAKTGVTRSHTSEANASPRSRLPLTKTSSIKSVFAQSMSSPDKAASTPNETSPSGSVIARFLGKSPLTMTKSSDETGGSISKSGSVSSLFANIGLKKDRSGSLSRIDSPSGSAPGPTSELAAVGSLSRATSKVLLSTSPSGLTSSPSLNSLPPLPSKVGGSSAGSDNLKFSSIFQNIAPLSLVKDADTEERALLHLVDFLYSSEHQYCELLKHIMEDIVRPLVSNSHGNETEKFILGSSISTIFSFIGDLHHASLVVLKNVEKTMSTTQTGHMVQDILEIMMEICENVQSAFRRAVSKFTGSMWELFNLIRENGKFRDFCQNKTRSVKEFKKRPVHELLRCFCQRAKQYSSMYYQGAQILQSELLIGPIKEMDELVYETEKVVNSARELIMLACTMENIPPALVLKANQQFVLKEEVDRLGLNSNASRIPMMIYLLRDVVILAAGTWDQGQQEQIWTWEKMMDVSKPFVLPSSLSLKYKESFPLRCIQTSQVSIPGEHSTFTLTQLGKHAKCYVFAIKSATSAIKV